MIVVFAELFSIIKFWLCTCVKRERRKKNDFSKIFFIIIILYHSLFFLCIYNFSIENFPMEKWYPLVANSPGRVSRKSKITTWLFTLSRLIFISSSFDDSRRFIDEINRPSLWRIMLAEKLHDVKKRRCRRINTRERYFCRAGLFNRLPDRSDIVLEHR